MGEGCGSWFPQPQFDWRSPDLNSVAAPVSLGQLTTIPDMINLGPNMVSTAAGILPGCIDTEPPHLQIGQDNEPLGWIHRLPRFRRANLPTSNPILKEQFLSDAYINHREATAPKADFGGVQKRFLVFDQSGEQTTLFLSPDFGSPNLSPKPRGIYKLKEEDHTPKGDLNLHLGPISADAFDGDGTDSQSEMHEDTEELNALLYSDDDDDSDYTNEDDVTSTGHSPSTITAHDEQFEGFNEEVASSGGTTRKRKLFDGGNYSAPFPMNPASSVKPKISSEYEDDAESSCANGKTALIDDLCSLSGNKRMRKDKIRETVSLLRNMIPDGDGKDAIVVLDEAIGYLKSLRLKVKDFSC